MNISIILVGYPGSQCIVPASKYLTSKYLPEFHTTYLNYKGDIKEWSKYVAGYLEYLTDEYVIFALDDYLVSGPIDMNIFHQAVRDIGGDVVCVKLCESTEAEHLEYPVTTQYCIWHRKYLIYLLGQVNIPWEFEIEGSRIFSSDPNKKVLLKTCIPYFANSSISGRWEGIKLEGLKEEDINFLTTNKYVS